MSIGLDKATQIPTDLADNLDFIVEEASQAAFHEIAVGLEELGYPASGDFTPGETFAIEAAFKTFVLSMALNNPKIAAMQEED